jgi:hypothetical protein
MASVAAQEGPGDDPPIQSIEGPGKITPRQASSQHGAELPIKKAHLPVYLLIAFTLFDVVACFYLIHFTNFVFLQHFTNFLKFVIRIAEGIWTKNYVQPIIDLFL